jgi:type I restriction enzyme R subunit
VIGFIQETQADKYNLLRIDHYGDKVDGKILANIPKTYKDRKEKILELLRNKLKIRCLFLNFYEGKVSMSTVQS